MRNSSSELFSKVNCIYIGAQGKSNLRGFLLGVKKYPGTELSKNSADGALWRMSSIKQCLRSLKESLLRRCISGPIASGTFPRQISCDFFFFFFFFPNHLRTQSDSGKTSQTGPTDCLLTSRLLCCPAQLAFLIMTGVRYPLDTDEAIRFPPSGCLSLPSNTSN